MATANISELKKAPTTLKKERTIADLLVDPKVKAQMALALPKHMTADRLARIAMTEMRRVPALARCDQASFLGAVMQCAQIGLEPGGVLGHAYMVPFQNRKKGITEVQFIVGYRGMIDLAQRSGKILSLSARAVYQNDKFSYRFGLHEDIEHVQADDNRGDITHVYAVAHLTNGGTQFEVMSRSDVEKVRRMSKAANDGPWVTHFEEMAKKTVIRRLFKYLPISIELQHAVALDERADAGLSQGNDSVITGDFVVVDDDSTEEAMPPEREQEQLRPDALQKEEKAAPSGQPSDRKTVKANSATQAGRKTAAQAFKDPQEEKQPMSDDDFGGVFSRDGFGGLD